MSGMSKAALDRCRRLIIVDKSEEGNFRKSLRVVDPKSPSLTVFEYTVRTGQDFFRTKKALMAKYRIPSENVIEE